MNSIVFRIHRDDLSAGSLRGVRHQLAGHDERFLVCKRDALAGFDRAKRRDKPDGADRRRYYGLRLRMCRDSLETFRVQSDLRRGRSKFLKLALQSFRALIIINGNQFRFESRYLLGELRHVSPRTERNDTKVAEMFDNFEGVTADGACRTEDGDAFHTGQKKT